MERAAPRDQRHRHPHPGSFHAIAYTSVGLGDQGSAARPVGHTSVSGMRMRCKVSRGAEARKQNFNDQ